MKNIKCFLMVCCVVMLAAGVSQAQTGTMALYSDEAGTDCNLYDVGDACPLMVHVIYKGTIGSAASEFMLIQAGGAALVYLGIDLPLFGSISQGVPETGIAVAYGGCTSAPVHLLTVIYQGIGASSTCSQIQIMPHPHSQYQNGANIALVDCQINIRYAAPGHLTVNPDEGCGCKTGPGVTPTPVFDTSWGQIKSLYVN